MTNDTKFSMKDALYKLVTNDIPHMKADIRLLRLALLTTILPLILIILTLILTLHTV